MGSDGAWNFQLQPERKFSFGRQWYSCMPVRGRGRGRGRTRVRLRLGAKAGVRARVGEAVGSGLG